MKRTIAIRVSVILLGTMLSSCGGGGGSNPGPPAPGSPTAAALSVVVPTSPYASVLIDCVLADTSSESCILNDLPLLAQQAGNPSIDDILARTVVSHEWMGIRFRQVLTSMPAELIALFSAVTAIVIDAEVRPSFYSPLTGAIYLDPAYLWLSNTEKATVSKVPDYRSDFGNDLNFVSLARYVEGTEYAWESYSLSGNESRTINDIVRPLAMLLFHELTHANDFFPPSEVINMDSTMSVLEAADSLVNISISARLAGFQPLTSQTWVDLAEVLYDGATSTTTQRSLTAQQVGIEFEIDGANDDYAYSSIFEDPAMLFTEVMMQYHFGIEREIAYTDQPPAGMGEYCDDYTIRWGYRNRVGDFRVKPRAELVLQLVLNQSDVSVYIDNLAAPKQMSSGLDWCTIQALGPPPKSAATKAGRATLTASAGKSGQRLRPDDRIRQHK